MRAPFMDLRLIGELRCGGAHDILTRKRACARRDSATGTTVGEEGPFDGWRKARSVPGQDAH